MAPAPEPRPQVTPMTNTREQTVSRTVTDMSGRGRELMSGGTRTATTGRTLVCRILGKLLDSVAWQSVVSTLLINKQHHQYK